MNETQGEILKNRIKELFVNSVDRSNPEDKTLESSNVLTGRENPEEELEKAMWDAVTAFSGYEFRTAKGLTFSYTVKGNELFISRKKKSITRSSVDIALGKVLEAGGYITGPKKLTVFGASYLYPVFLKLGLIREREN